jgi:GT2 family glycosyltransferase
MMSGGPPQLACVVLTVGNRPRQLGAAVASLTGAGSVGDVLVVNNGGPPIELGGPGVRLIDVAENLGVPGGRDHGLRATTADIVGFLDDDAILRPDGAERVVEAFAADRRLGAVALRLVDEAGQTARRHVPRAGRRGEGSTGEVALFLGGACAIRREAYDDAGGYFTDLFYGHEELELSWRLVDRGWRIRYLADVEVFHPRTDISRHADGWALTGRNRVWIARRTLPWPVAALHVTIWLLLGLLRAPGRDCRRQYLRGWWSGWRGHVTHDPIRWSTVWKLARLGRPPFV